MKLSSQNLSTGARVARWHFADCTLDAINLELMVRGELVRLEPKPLEVLIFLLSHPDEVVTKEELQEQVWPGRVLSESVLSKTVAKLRLALADEGQTIVKTVHGFGYRLVAPVRVEAAAPNMVARVASLQVGATLPLRPHWQLVQQLGAGGHGDVWLARHDGTGETRVFKFGVDVHSLAGLKREITLSRVLLQTHGEHPALLRILDWNLDELPYFIEVEHIAGGSLAQWANSRGGLAALPLQLRLELAAQIADALALVHSAGVLHKDLKPSNLLVAEPDALMPRLKLADFGSGRVLDLARLEQLEITRLGFTSTASGSDTSGTPFYLAPELLAGQPPTVRSDVFALGIILFQLAVGDFSRPLAPGWEHEIDDEILREDIGAAAAIRPEHRLADAGDLARRIRELPQRRQRREANRRASSESTRLRAELEKARERRLRALTLSVVFGVGAVVATWQGFAARAARMDAEQQRATAQREALASAAVSRFLVDDLIAVANPAVSGRAEMSVREALGLAEGKVAEKFASVPSTEGAVRLAIGSAWFSLGDYDRSKTQLDAALTRIKEPTPQAAAHLQLGMMAIETNALENAQIELQKAVALDAAEGESQLQAELHLAWLENLKGNYAESESKLQALKPRFVARFGADDASIDKLLEALGSVQTNAGRINEGLATLRENVDRVVRRHGERDLRAINAWVAYVGALNWAERDAEALPIAETTCKIARETLGENHVNTLRCGYWQGQVLYWLNRHAEAKAVLEPTLERLRKQFGESHPIALDSLTVLAKVMGALGDEVKELALLEQGLLLQRKANGERHDSALQSAFSLAKAQLRTGKLVLAEAQFRRTLDIALADYADNRYFIGELRMGLADCLLQGGQAKPARALLDAAEDDLLKSVGADHSSLQITKRLREKLNQMTALEG